MRTNITDFINKLTIPEAELSFDRIGNTGRVTLTAALFSLIKLDEQTKPIFSYIEKVSLEKLDLDIESSCDTQNLLVNLKQLSLVNAKSKIQIKDIAILLDLAPFLKTNDSTQKPTLKGRAAGEITIEDSFLNKAIMQNKGLLSEKGIKELNVTFINNRISIKGIFKHIVDINFETDLSAKLINNMIVLNIERLYILKFLSIPSFISNLIMAIAGSQVQNNIIKFKEKRIIINIRKILPQEFNVNLKAITIQDNKLTISIKEKKDIQADIC